MTLLNAWALGFLGAVPIIVLLYLLKLRRRTAEVSTLMFWRQALQENRRRALFQRLRNWLSLLLHLLIFLLILFALAKPEWRSLAASASSTVIIIDTRARMQAAVTGGGSRLERAKQLGLEFTSRVGTETEFAILSAHALPEVVAPFTSSEATLRKGLEELTATDAGGSLQEAVHLAEQLLSARDGRRRIVVLSDPAASDAIKSKEMLEVVRTGAADDNVAITRFAVRALPASEQTAEVLLEVQNFGAGTADGSVEITCDGSLVDVKRFALKPNERMTEVFSIAPPRHVVTQGRLVAKLGVADALSVDDTAYAVLPGSQPRRVLLVSKENWFLEKVFAADHRVQFEILTPESFRPEIEGSFDAVVFDDSLPANFDLASAAGNYLFIKKTPWPPVGEPLPLPPVTDVDAAHPLLRLVSFQDVRFLRATRLGDDAEIAGWKLRAVLRSFEHPLIIAATRARPGTNEQRFVAAAFDVAESDLPLRVAFPLFVSNTVRWLAGEQSETNQAPRTGEIVSLAPAQVATFDSGPAAGAAVSKKLLSPFRGSFRPLQNGFYAVSEAGKVDFHLAANTFSAEESNLRHAIPPRPAGGPSLPPTSFAPDWSVSLFRNRPFWHFLALTAFLLFTLEWWLYHQRRSE